MTACDQCGGSGKVFVAGTAKNSKKRVVCGCKLMELEMVLDDLKEKLPQDSSNNNNNTTAG